MKNKKEKKKKNNKNIIINVKVLLLIAIVIALVTAGATAYATTYLVNSREVKYDNSTSGLTSTNVQDAIVELNNNATDYTSLSNRITALENSLGGGSVGLSAYPVGSIFISISNTNPGTIFGGTWVSFGTGRTLVGVNTSDGSFNTVEKTGGAKSVTLATTNLPSHTHSIPALSGTAASAGTHTHTVSGTTSSNGNHNHRVGGWLEVAYTGGGYKVHWIYDGQDRRNYTSSNGEHTHTVSGTAESSGVHTHSVTTTASTTGATGSGTAVSIMDPYITVYMWKRTA